MIMTGNIPKALSGGKTVKKQAKPVKPMKADKMTDAKMSLGQMKQDISSDKKLQTQKTKKQSKK